MNTIDSKLLRRLQKDGRASWATLGKLVDLTPPAVAERVKRLEEQGVIKGFAVLLDPSELGLELTAMVSVTLERPKDRKAFLELVDNLPEIQECHHVTGDYDYMLKLRCSGTSDLDRLVNDELKSLPGVMRMHTTIVLRTTKETPALAVRKAGDE